MAKPEDIRAGDEISAQWHMDVRDAAFADSGGNAPGASGPGGTAYRPADTESEPYAKAQSGWDENDNDPKVSVKTCDADGTNERGEAFDVYLPRRNIATGDTYNWSSDYSPDIRTGHVIRWGWDHEGRRICLSEYLNDTPYAKAQSNWARNSGSPRVAVKTCDADGSNVRGDAYYVYLPHRRATTSATLAVLDYDPDIRSGDVIQWRGDIDGNRICTSPYLKAIPYAVAQSDWAEGATSADQPKVSVKACTEDGTLLDGAEPAFNVLLPRRRDRAAASAAESDYDPDIYSGDVITWHFDHDGNRVCSTPYLSSKVGDVREQVANTRIQAGWCEMIYANIAAHGTLDHGHRVAMGRETESAEDNENAAGDTGGYRWHGQTEEGGTANNHTDHSRGTIGAVDEMSGTVYPNTPSGVDSGGDTMPIGWGEFLESDSVGVGTNDVFPHDGPFNTNVDTDNRMPFIVLIKVQRYK